MELMLCIMTSFHQNTVWEFPFEDDLEEKHVT